MAVNSGKPRKDLCPAGCCLAAAMAEEAVPPCQPITADKPSDVTLVMAEAAEDVMPAKAAAHPEPAPAAAPSTAPAAAAVAAPVQSPTSGAPAPDAIHVSGVGTDGLTTYPAALATQDAVVSDAALFVCLLTDLNSRLQGCNPRRFRPSKYRIPTGVAPIPPALVCACSH